MKPVFQTICDPGRGDCMRAAIASMFELEIEQVPHFVLFGHKHFEVFWYFVLAMGYEIHGTGWPCHPYQDHITPDEIREKINKIPAVNGCYYASVPSKTFEGVTHAVLIDSTGMVIHDPNPNQKWLGINVVDTKDIIWWQLIEKKVTV